MYSDYFGVFDTHQVACVVDEDAPFDFEGATITGCDGWEQGLIKPP